MDDKKVADLLNSLDDDLINEQIDTMIHDIDIDYSSIRKKAVQKLKGKEVKIMKRKRRIPMAIAACLTILTVSTIFAEEISTFVKSYMDKSIVGSTVVEGDAYTLPETEVLEDGIEVTALYLWRDNLEMECVTKLDLEHLGKIEIRPHNSQQVYEAGGYSREGDKYYFRFDNALEQNSKIEPFKEFTLAIGGKEYPITLQGSMIEIQEEAEVCVPKGNIEIEGLHLEALVEEKDGEELLYVIPSLDDNLVLFALGTPKAREFQDEIHFREDGIVSSSTPPELKPISYMNAEGLVKELIALPKLSHHASTVYRMPTDDVIDKVLIDDAIVMDQEVSQTKVLSIPANGIVEVNEDVDLTHNKLTIQTVERINDDTIQIKLMLNTGEDQGKKIMSLDCFSENVRDIVSAYNEDEVVMNVNLKEAGQETVDLQFSYPILMMHGEWELELNE